MIPPDDTSGSDQAPDAPELLEFLLYLGSGLTAAGEAVNRIEDRLRRVAAAYGAPRLRVSVLPTYLVIALEPGQPATLEPTPVLRGTLRLNQTAALYDVLKAAEHGAVVPADGARRIWEILAMPPRFGRTVTILGHLTLTAGICTVLRPTVSDLVLAGAFGALVGALKVFAGRWTSAQILMPVIASFVVAALTLIAADSGWADAEARAMIAPLVTFLPGAVLTMGVVDISAAQLVTGASRLVAGTLQLVLLAFGLLGAVQVVGLPRPDVVVVTSEYRLGAWAPWLGVFLVGVGNYLYRSAPRRSLGWLCLVLYAAWVGRYLGEQVFSGYMSGFTGALLMTMVAYVVERRPSGPPALVSFLPAFWLLVPGGVSLIGVTEVLNSGAAAATPDLIGATGTIMAIALGVLCGYPMYRRLGAG
ncbi:threonine/serine ThrE exporter family protein [Krasilnikovia sp. MM14-A1004]|uniref:threonine/serine ThrE exporter family protein n=1 Tax=Krasilnikovia sp. MM14-A1004 TaxID=3373541 RepID=UPI00399CDB9F